MPNEKVRAKLSSPVKEVQTHRHTTSGKKKKGVSCGFSAAWPPSERTLIVLGGKDIDKNVLAKIKKVLDLVLLQITQIDNLQDINLTH